MQYISQAKEQNEEGKVKIPHNLMSAGSKPQIAGFHPIPGKAARTDSGCFALW